MAGLVGGGAPRTPENFRKFAKIFLNKIAKNALFWPIFQRKFKNPALNFRSFGRKTIGLGKSEKILNFFD